jgi:hypothetical protein
MCYVHKFLQVPGYQDSIQKENDGSAFVTTVVIFFPY